MMGDELWLIPAFRFIPEVFSQSLSLGFMPCNVLQVSRMGGRGATNVRMQSLLSKLMAGNRKVAGSIPAST